MHEAREQAQRRPERALKEAAPVQAWVEHDEMIDDGCRQTSKVQPENGRPEKSGRSLA